MIHDEKNKSRLTPKKSKRKKRKSKSQRPHEKKIKGDDTTMPKRKISMNAVRAAIKSPKTPPALKKGLIKKYGSRLKLKK